MKFKDYKYERPDIELLTNEFKTEVQNFKEAKDFETADQAMNKINEMKRRFETMATLTNIRHTINTKDEFYEEEDNFFNDINPIMANEFQAFYQVLIESPYQEQIKEKYGEHILNIAELSIKTINDKVIELCQKENRLSSEYTKLTAGAQIEFDGKILNLAQLDAYTQSSDRSVRKAAADKYTGFLAENQDQLDRIYDDMVKVRTEIAHQLGYENYIQLGYDRLLRTEYNADHVKFYRDQIVEYIVPLAVELRKRQAKRIGLDSLKYYDEPFGYKTGNPKPHGEGDWIVDRAIEMYHELSPETSEFIDFMTSRELLDLESKDGKAGGGYCTSISEYRSPFIFANFNGTSHDVEVLTHEAGHAFQVYNSIDAILPEYVWPTYEACEIHSMSMEFLTWPWMEKFFEDETEKFYFNHLAHGILFLPYGALVDEFQHEVYSKPEMTPKERRATWSRLEKKYLPTKDNSGNTFLEEGGFWFRQLHIFGMPFYYIDYTLAQVCAFQYWIRSLEDRDSTWKDYLKICKIGGSLPFLQIVEAGGIKNPFQDGVIKEVSQHVQDYLDGIDDSEM